MEINRKKTCPKCGEEFIIITNRQIYCTRKCYRQSILDRARKRYNSDKEFRNYIREYQRRWYKENHDKVKRYAEDAKNKKLDRAYNQVLETKKAVPLDPDSIFNLPKKKLHALVFDGVELNKLEKEAKKHGEADHD